MSLRMAKPSWAPAVASKPPNWGTAKPKLFWREGNVQVGARTGPGWLMPTVTLRLVSWSVSDVFAGTRLFDGRWSRIAAVAVRVVGVPEEPAMAGRCCR